MADKNGGKKEEKEVQKLFDEKLPQVPLPKEVADRIKEKVLEEVEKTLKE